MEEQKQVRINLVTNIVTLVVSVVVGLVYTPYLVRTLGVAAYGIVPLALVINNYISVFTGSLTGSLTRFYSVALQKGDTAAASSYLSTSLAVIALILMALTPLLGVLVWKLDSVFNIPPELVPAARVLFALTTGSFFVSVISSIFNITLYALNRLDLVNVIKMSRQVFRLVFVILFFAVFDADIAFIGYANMATETILLAVSVAMFVRTKPAGITIRADRFSRAAILSVMGMTVWVLVHNLGDVGIYRTDSFLANIFWGTRESGIVGAISELGSYIMMVMTVISSLLHPLIIIAYAKGDHDKVKRLSLTGSILLGVSTAAVCGVLAGYSEPFLNYWLGSEFAGYNLWLILKILPVSFSAASAGFIYTYRVWNKVRFPALATLGFGILNLAATALIMHLMSPSESGITVALAVSAGVVFLQGYCLNAFCFNRIYRGHGRGIIYNAVRIALVLAAAAAFSHLCSEALPDTPAAFIAGIALCAAAALALGWFVAMKGAERRAIKDIFRTKEILKEPAAGLPSEEKGVGL